MQGRMAPLAIELAEDRVIAMASKGEVSTLRHDLVDIAVRAYDPVTLVEDDTVVIDWQALPNRVVQPVLKGRDSGHQCVNERLLVHRSLDSLIAKVEAIQEVPHCAGLLGGQVEAGVPFIL